MNFATLLRGQLDDLVKKYVADGPAPGVSVAVVDREALLYEGVGGMSHAEIPIDTSMLFEIGSIGKVFTALLIMTLAEKGQLSVDDAVAQHLDWFELPEPGSGIAIRHLLSHTGGITSGVDATPEDAFQVWSLRSMKPGSAPGQRFQYSNVGYKALGLVLEAVSGVRYTELIRQRVLAPLGMNQTEPCIANGMRHKLAVGHCPARDDRPYKPGYPLAPATWLETATADGSIASTAADLSIFLQVLMRNGGDLLSSSSLDFMASPVDSLHAEGYGHGLHQQVVDNHRYLGHGGATLGYRSALQWDQEAGKGAVVLQNGPGGDPIGLARALIRAADQSLRGKVIDITTPSSKSNSQPEGSHPTFDQRSSRPEVGLFRSHNPWTPKFMVESGEDNLWLTFTSPPNGFSPVQPLVVVAGGYQVGDDPLGPETLSFDTMIDGRFRRAWLSGWDFYRVDDHQSRTDDSTTTNYHAPRRG